MTFSIICNECGVALRPKASIVRHRCRPRPPVTSARERRLAWLFLFLVSGALGYGVCLLLDAWLATGRPTP